jgi:L-ascorbate metabolism protein UlaG (beta-lactamase superfamily)
MPRFPVSDHCDGERFFNPHAITGRTTADVIKWQRTRERNQWPGHVPLRPHAPPPARVADGQIAVTFISHATFLLRTSSGTCLTDPVFTSHAGPLGRLGPRRVREAAIVPSALPHLDVILVTHNHYDHLQPQSLRDVASKGTPAIVTALGLAPSLEGFGLSRVTELDWWGETHLGGDWTITAVPAQHFSARTPFDRNRTLWVGFVVRSGGRTIYFAGDTGYSPHFIEIGRRFPRIDLALIPIGAYEPRWFMQPMHVNPEEAVRIHQDVGSRLSIGMHFGTFHLTDEPIDEPLRALERARQAAGVREEDFRVLDFGETLIV